MGKAALYDTDIVAWADEQAERLRALARRPQLSNAIDWDNVVEEIESVGRTEIRVVASAIRQMLVHALKAVAEPESRALAHWRTEFLTQHITATDDFTPSMAGRIDLQKLWRQAMREADSALAEHGARLPTALPARCPVALEDVLIAALTIDQLAMRLVPVDSVEQ